MKWLFYAADYYDDILCVISHIQILLGTVRLLGHVQRSITPISLCHISLIISGQGIYKGWPRVGERVPYTLPAGMHAWISLALSQAKFEPSPIPTLQTI